MTVSLGNGSDAALKTALDGIRTRAAARGFVTPKLKNANPDTLQLCLPHRLGFVHLNELLADESLNLRRVARILGWRFFIHASDKPIAAAHVTRTVQGELRLSELNEGQFVNNTMEALQIVLSEKENRSFELLLLVAPAVCFVGWWAQFDDERHDWVLPVTPTIHRLGPDAISPSKLLLALKTEFIQASQFRNRS